MKNSKKVIWMMALLALSASGWAEEKKEEAPPAPASFDKADYQRQIRSGDSLNITVWQHKDLSASVVVDEAGNIEYLFLGVIAVEGKTVAELKELLRQGIAKNYIVDPKIDISLDRKSLTFFVAGEVNKPGTYEFLPNVTVLEAVTVAGGFTDYASRRVKIIRRGTDGKEHETSINTKKLLRANDKRAESKIRPDDIVVAGRSWL